jgi:hypothetical protein
MARLTSDNVSPFQFRDGRDDHDDRPAQGSCGTQKFHPGLHKHRRSRALRSIRSPCNGCVRADDSRFFHRRIAGTIRSACFDSKLRFSRDSLPLQGCSATCSIRECSGALPGLTGSREPLPAEAAGVLSRASGEAASADGRCQAHIAEDSQLSARSVLGGLHHEYAWDRIAA